MCLIVFAYRYHPDYPFILAANRDEFYDRPTSKAHFWKDHPGVLAGRDGKYGGTWMGITRSGRFAAVTNFRDSSDLRVHPRSRGLMVKDFLTSDDPIQAFLERIISRQGEYNGFNLLLGDRSSLVYHSNRGTGTRILEPGLYGLSNHLLDTPWPKVVRARRALAEILDEPGPVDIETFFEILHDRTPAPDRELPDTGFGLQWERVLSSPFIVTPAYGTRASTVLLLHKAGRVNLKERSFGKSGDSGVTHHEFALSET